MRARLNHPLALAALMHALLSAQESPAPVPPVPTTSAATPAPTMQRIESYTYDPSGRRDPFVSLLGAVSQPRVAVQRGEGKAGLAVAEISVRGVMQSRGGFIAIVQGPDGRTFVVRPGDRFADGTVKEVYADGLVIVQEVKDPMSLVKQREVSKKLRSLEAKQ